MTPADETGHMVRALELAEEAALAGEVPVGAVIVGPGGERVAEARNRMKELADPSGHAEMEAIRAACRVTGSDRLPDHDLYVTLEPCAMCAAAISFARIRRLYFGAGDPKSGAVDHGPVFFEQPTCHHAPEIYGDINGARSRALLQAFFKDRR